jgi:hypothetical protein
MAISWTEVVRVSMEWRKLQVRRWQILPDRVTVTGEQAGFQRPDRKSSSCRLF